MLAAIVLAACTHASDDGIEAGIIVDAGRPCALPTQIELRSAASGTCSGQPSVVLTLAADGSVQHAAAHVPVGVSVPATPCASRAPVDSATCTWDLDVVCDGSNGEHLAVTGAIHGHDARWAGDAVTIDMTGLPPGRLTCTSTGAVATP